MVAFKLICVLVYRPFRTSWLLLATKLTWW